MVSACTWGFVDNLVNEGERGNACDRSFAPYKERIDLMLVRAQERLPHHNNQGITTHTSFTL